MKKEHGPFPQKENYTLNFVILFLSILGKKFQIIEFPIIN